MSSETSFVGKTLGGHRRGGWQDKTHEINPLRKIKRRKYKRWEMTWAAASWRQLSPAPCSGCSKMMVGTHPPTSSWSTYGL